MTMTPSTLDTSEVSGSARDSMDITTSSPKPNVLVSDEVHDIVSWVLFGALLMIICTFGIGSNVVNIICFVRQGLNDPINVSVLGLAISDLGVLVTSIAIGIGHGPALKTLDLPVQMIGLVYIVCGPPFLFFTGMSSCITALIALERCLCISMPAKVKSIITPKRVATTLVCNSILFIFSSSTMFGIAKLSWIFSPVSNRTVLELVYKEHSDILEQISFFLNSALIPFSAYFTIIICTLTLIAKLRDKAKWRRSATSSIYAENTAKRDQNVAKMVVMISVLYIVCFTPACLTIISLVTVPELAFGGPNQNLFSICAGVSTVLQNGNSSANIFIYYHMSSRYRSTFRDLFRCEKMTKSAK